MYSSGLWMPIKSDWYTDESKVEQWAGEGKSHPSGYKEVFLNPVWENSELSSEHRMKHYNQINDIVFPALDKSMDEGSKQFRMLWIKSCRR